MLEERSGSSGGMSLAELVLVTAVPQKQIAASAKSASASSHAGHAHHGAGKGKGEDKKPDVHKLAEEVYAEILKLIDTARERSGDPYQ
jgi:ribosomal protein S25